tara:strand:+ start:1257 stop:1580 length:324 start_codon:yes stop_codon:yes gene_type:complete
MTKKKKKYFPNKWKAYSEIPAEKFESLPFDTLMEWKIGGYEIPSSHVAMLRVRNIDTGKVKEYVYKYRHAAIKKCRKLLSEGNKEITIVQQDCVQLIGPTDEIFNPY